MKKTCQKLQPVLIRAYCDCGGQIFTREKLKTRSRFIYRNECDKCGKTEFGNERFPHIQNWPADGQEEKPL